MANFSLVADSSFKPFSLQELMTPMMMYKDAYEKTEAAYADLSDKANKFKYLSETLPEGSKARQIYEGYANDLNAQAEDLIHNGLNMGNRRAISSLRRRFQGEIGQLEEADKALQKEKDLRRTMAAKDPSMLYAVDNLNIDSYLNGATPNLYGISGDTLYAKGAAASKAASSRLYSNPTIERLSKQYLDIVSTQGYSPELAAAFRQNMASIPELQKAVYDILKANGVTDNLKEGTASYNQAVQQTLNGIIDGITYQRSDKPVEDGEYMSAAQRDTSARGWESQNLSAAVHGITKDENGKYVSQDEWMYTHDKNGARNGYSEEYKKAVKEGLVPGKNVKIGKDEKGDKNNKNSQGGKSKTRIAKPSVSFADNGQVTQLTTANGQKLGEYISYAEATSRYSNISDKIAQYVGENSDLYDYYDSGSGIRIVGHRDGGTKAETTTSDTPDDSDNKEDIY